MLINPGRETFLNFPSAIMGNDKTVTVFLPEPAIPLHKRYPVVYLLGAIPKEAPLVQQCLDRSNQKAILVGINFTEQDLADTDKIAAFISRELVPYIDVNYMTKDEPAWRGVAALQHGVVERYELRLLAFSPAVVASRASTRYCSGHDRRQ